MPPDALFPLSNRSPSPIPKITEQSAKDCGLPPATRVLYNEIPDAGQARPARRGAARSPDSTRTGRICYTGAKQSRYLEMVRPLLDLRKVLLICCCAALGLVSCDTPAPTPIPDMAADPVITTGLPPGEAKAETARTVIRFAATNDMLTPMMISDFEKVYPLIHIERVEPRQYPLLDQEQEAGKMPDILSIPLEDFPYYAREGLALNLGDYATGNPAFEQSGLFPVANFFRYEDGRHGSGSLFGFLKGWSPGSALLYNKSLFDAAQLAYPDPKAPMTWEELLAAMRALTVRLDGRPVQYGLGQPGASSIMNPYMYRLQMAQLEKTPWYDHYNKADFTNEQSKRIFTYWMDVLQGELGPSPMNRVTASAEELFLTGKLALLIADYPFAMQLEQTGIDLSRIGIAPLPVFEDGRRVSPFQSKSVAIVHAGTKHPEAAWTVFAWYMTGRQAEDWALQGGEFPVSRAQLQNLPISSPWTSGVAAHFRAQLPYVEPLPDFNPYLTEEVLDNLFDKCLTPVYFRQSELQNALYRLTQETNFEIQENR